MGKERNGTDETTDGQAYIFGGSGAGVFQLQFVFQSWSQNLKATFIFKRAECNRMQLSAMECLGVQYNATECNGMQQNATEFNGMQQNVTELNGIKRN